MRKIVVVLAAGAAVYGCATSQRQIDSHTPAFDSWVGAPIEEFLDTQGTPTTVIERVEYQIYRFDAQKSRIYTQRSADCQPVNPREPYRPRQCSTTERRVKTATFTCRYELLVADSVINDWRMDGNNCKMVTVDFRPG